MLNLIHFVHVFCIVAILCESDISHYSHGFKLGTIGVADVLEFVKTIVKRMKETTSKR